MPGFQNYSFTQPSYLAEFEGGYFTAWGSGTFYDTVIGLMGALPGGVALLKNDSVLRSTIRRIQISCEFPLHPAHLSFFGLFLPCRRRPSGLWP